jgi:hypothetical protein
MMALVLLSACGGGSSSSGGHCGPALAKPPNEPAYADTVWPTEHHDAWRTHAAAAGLPVHVSSQQLTVTSVETPPTPTWGYVGADGSVYVLGGAPFLLDVFTDLIQGAPRDSIPALIAASKEASDNVTPYLARIDPATLQIETLDLSGGTAVNYVGGVLVHSNGYLYAVARGVLFKIDPTIFQIVLSTSLPLAPDSSGQPNENTAFNGMQATDDGDLILKGFASISTGDAPGILLRINPDDLSIKARLDSDTVAAARLTVASVQSQQYLYVPGKNSSLRFGLEEHAFVPNANYTQQYLQSGDGSTAGSSDVFMGKGVVFANNTEPQATSAMHLFGETATGSSLTNVPAFDSTDTSWNFFMVAGDPFKSGIVVVEDQLHGQVSGFIACGDGRTVEKLWENDSLEVSAGAAIAYDRGQLYVDDRQCDSSGACQLYLVVLDLNTGDEIARAPVQGTKPSIGQIFIGAENAVYFPATDTGTGRGYLSRVSTS